jgi:hypothetical protein
MRMSPWPAPRTTDIGALSGDSLHFGTHEVQTLSCRESYCTEGRLCQASSIRSFQVYQAIECLNDRYNRPSSAWQVSHLQLGNNALAGADQGGAGGPWPPFSPSSYDKSTHLVSSFMMMWYKLSTIPSPGSDPGSIRAFSNSGSDPVQGSKFSV